MKIKAAAGDKGLVRMIVLIVIAILVVSYFGINIRALVSSPTTQDNISYVTTAVVNVWNNFLKVPAAYLWNEIFVNLIWKPAISNLQNAKFEAPSVTSSTTPVFLQ